MDYIYKTIQVVGFIKCNDALDCSSQGDCYFSFKQYAAKFCTCYINYIGNHCQINTVSTYNLSIKINDTISLLNEIFEVVYYENKAISFITKILKNLSLLINLLSVNMIWSMLFQCEAMIELLKGDPMILSMILSALGQFYYHNDIFSANYYIFYSRIKLLILKSVYYYSKNFNKKLPFSSNLSFYNDFLNISINELYLNNLSYFVQDQNFTKTDILLSDNLTNILIKSCDFIIIVSLTWKYLPEIYTLNNNIVTQVKYFNFFDVISNDWFSTDTDSYNYTIKIPILTSLENWKNLLMKNYIFSSYDAIINNSNFWVCQAWNHITEQWENNSCSLTRFINDCFYCMCSNFSYKEFSVRINLQAISALENKYVYQVSILN